MPKLIAFLADGTWNGRNVDKDGDGQFETTNVLRLYQNLAGIDTETHRAEGEREVRDTQGNLTQIVKYLHGVGDSKNPLVQFLGGAMGVGLVSRVVRGYTFICRNYQPGDRIILAGFSRGAYTVRALGGMIAKAGLMDYAKLGNPDKSRAYMHGMYVWAYYRQKKHIDCKSSGPGEVWDIASARDYAVGEEHMIPSHEGMIDAIGVWDTVGALGIPVFDQDNKPLDLFRFADTDLNVVTKRGFHALSIDEQRATFTPTPWTPRTGIEQVWFAGVHSDVGGGYETNVLSDFALEWMMKKLALNGNGLRYKTPLTHIPAPDACGKQHNSWKGLYCLLPRKNREVNANSQAHESVRTRLRCPNLSYRPAGRESWPGGFVN